MKVIGIIGGVSWESSAEYYRLINQKVKERLGGLHSAELILYSLDFELISQWEHEGQWDQIASCILETSQKLQSAGADFILIASNTLHKIVPEIESRLSIPIVHIADAVAKTIQEAEISTVALLGTRFVMEESFYKERLEKAGIDILILSQEAREFIHNMIYHELARGEIRASSKEKMVEIIEEMISMGAEGIVLANTELPLIVSPEELKYPIFDSMKIHIGKAMDLAL
ncbi:aspartate/glutamate racemase family protein [Sulfuricurvum sp.]|uniref:aspartate/glutamate racemase family protein n=1 Tax=Sulfuricurvum sp. TaxID=2025608 RepID=UPI0035619C14